MWTDLNDLHTKRKASICRFWILKVDFDYIFSSCCNKPFCKGTVHVIVCFYWSCKILSFSNDCNSGVYGPIWMIFILRERRVSVDFEYWKLILITYFHPAVISHFVRVQFTLLFVFTEVVKYCHFQTIVTQVYVDRSEWSSYQKKGKNL